MHLAAVVYVYFTIGQNIRPVHAIKLFLLPFIGRVIQLQRVLFIDTDTIYNS